MSNLDEVGAPITESALHMADGVGDDTDETGAKSVTHLAAHDRDNRRTVIRKSAFLLNSNFWRKILNPPLVCGGN